MSGVYPAGWKFDNPAYNWLADPYGAAVNPRFWKIHGYVDNAIMLWLRANGKKRIALECPQNDADCHQWSGEWIGNLPVAVTQSKDIPRAAGPHAGDADRDFNRQRLKHQRLGVIEDVKKGMPGAPVKAGPTDLLEVARQKVCP
jgi:hypothetical protein